MADRWSGVRRFPPLLAAGLVLACAERVAPGTPPYLTVFLIDGLAQEVFERELASGHLPEIARLIQEGAYVPNGIGAFPSMTAYGFYPFLTGHDAVASDVLGLRWFDRSLPRGNHRNYVGRTRVLMNHDLNPAIATSFEAVDDQYTSAFNSAVDRGATAHISTGWSFSAAKYRDTWWVPGLLADVPLVGKHLVPDWESAESDLMDRVVEDLERRPKIQWVVFASPDGYAHVHGVDSAYSAILRHLDGLIGRYRERSRQLGVERERLYAVLSDHGMIAVRENVDLRRHLEAHYGLALQRDPPTYVFSADIRTGLSAYEGADAILVVNGNTMNYLYVRNPREEGSRAWRIRPAWDDLLRYPTARGPVNWIEAVRRAPGVELVVAQDEVARVHVWDRTGWAVLEHEGDNYAYRPMQGDPLGYLPDSLARTLADGRFHTPAEWLEATALTRFPYAVVRLYDLASHPSAGDLVVTALPGFDLADDFELIVGDYRGGHGGLRADQLRVPYILAGPGVRPGARLRTARAEDIGATLHRLLGIAPSGRPDGRVLSEILQPRAQRSAGSP